MNASAEHKEPITVCVSRRIKPGKEAEYETWLKGISKAGSDFEGHMGVNVLRPSPKTGGEYVLIYRFDNYEHARIWEQSDVRRQWLEQLDAQGAVETQARRKVNGLEVWFDLPSVPVAAKPKPHKMVLVLFVVVYMLVSGLNWVLSPVMEGQPFWLRLMVIIFLQTSLMTYVVMPRITAWLKSWLYQ